MKIELVKWILGNLELHAISLDGEIYVNNKTVCVALGIPKASLTSLLQNNSEEFNMLQPLRVGFSNPKELEQFLRNNQEALGIDRVRKDMVWHSAEEVYGICYLSGGEKARQTRREFTKLLRQHERVNSISPEEFREHIEWVQIQFAEKDAEIAALRRVVDRSGSYFGSGLNEVKKVKTTKAY